MPTYDGKPIAAFYFSTSGGHTENIENVWQTSPIAYLKGVDDPYDTYSPLHFWPENPILHAAAWYKDRLGSHSTDNPTGVKGTLRAVYVVKRGTSPRVVKAAIIGTNGVTFVSGATLRYKLALRDTWASFTSMSMVADSTTVTYGVGTRVRGRIYPALKDGATVKLHYVRDGASGSLTVTTNRQTQDLGNGYTAAYSTYSFTAKPKKQTTYQYVVGQGAFAEGHAQGAARGHDRRPTRRASPPAASSSSPARRRRSCPARRSGCRRRAAPTWTNAVSAVFDADGTCSFDWTAVAGVTAARFRVPATAGFVTGYSPAVAPDRHRVVAPR